MRIPTKTVFKTLQIEDMNYFVCFKRVRIPLITEQIVNIVFSDQIYILITIFTVFTGPEKRTINCIFHKMNAIRTCSKAYITNIINWSILFYVNWLFPSIYIVEYVILYDDTAIMHTSPMSTTQSKSFK